MNVKLSKAQKVQVRHSLDLYAVMRQVLMREKKTDRNKEHLWVICLSARLQILLIELISLGTVNETLVDPRDVFSFALQKREAHGGSISIVLVHNHPSNIMMPSEADMLLTDRMQAIGKFLEIPVIDHLIIGETDYYSFADEGMLQKIVEESNYDLNFKQIDILKREMKSVEERKAREMAKKALEKKLSIELIAEISGLTLKQVEVMQKMLNKKKKPK